MSSNIVYRREGSGTTVVQASNIKDQDDLAYAMGFLANHKLYKMSKANGEVDLENALEVAEALEGAAARFAAEVLDRLNPSEMEGTISNLGLGEVTNPYGFVEKNSD